MDDDPYGFLSRADAEAVEVLDKAGLAAFEKQIRARYDSAATTQPNSTGSFADNPEYLRRRWGDALRALYFAQKNVEAYVAHANSAGLTAQDCHAIATMLGNRRNPGEALAWVERGIDVEKTTKSFSSISFDLPRLKRELLKKLGRGGEALAAAWAEYESHPSEYTYVDLMKLVPKAERTAWHAKAMDVAQGTELQSLIGLLLKTKEIERLAKLVRQSADAVLEGLSHYTTEPAAMKLEKSHPDAAARLWRAQGMRIINAGKSKYYDSALANFERAKHCFEKAGLGSEWQKTVARVQAEHHRKVAFLAGCNRIAAGLGKWAKPSFLERAKEKWNH